MYFSSTSSKIFLELFKNRSPTYIWHSCELSIQSTESFPSASRVEHLALGDRDFELHERNEPSTKPNCLRIPGVWDLGSSDLPMFECASQPGSDGIMTMIMIMITDHRTCHGYGWHKCEREPPTFCFLVSVCVCLGNEILGNNTNRKWNQKVRN